MFPVLPSRSATNGCGLGSSWKVPSVFPQLFGDGLSPDRVGNSRSWSEPGEGLPRSAAKQPYLSGEEIRGRRGQVILGNGEF